MPTGGTASQSGNTAEDLAQIVGAVEPHPTLANVWGLKNLGRHAWHAQRDGTRTEIAPGRSVRIVPGTQIDFGSRVGAIQQ